MPLTLTTQQWRNVTRPLCVCRRSSLCRHRSPILVISLSYLCWPCQPTRCWKIQKNVLWRQWNVGLLQKLGFSTDKQETREYVTTKIQASNKDKSTVDKLLHELLRKGDAAQKYIQGSKNMKFDHQINLDNYYKKNNSSGTRLRALQANSKRSKKHMSMKQLKRAGLLDLPEEFHKFELFISMHEMWKEYVIHLLKNIGKNQVAAILFGANLHGAIFRVVECKIDSFVGVLGIMIRETAETFGIITQDNKFRVVPKRGSVFVLQADCWMTTLLGDKFVSRKSGS
ncbi:ribonuclease MRP protein subunit POP4 isoform X2 [Silene latifolia]|uniref:ribonuclease MRP protein subunit POP4 isoform X2 n=1 Tax=Silene latifolia TaxID=37657 RepID=UPI003D7835FF